MKAIGVDRIHSVAWNGPSSREERRDGIRSEFCPISVGGSVRPTSEFRSIRGRSGSRFALVFADARTQRNPNRAGENPATRIHTSILGIIPHIRWVRGATGVPRIVETYYYCPSALTVDDGFVAEVIPPFACSAKQPCRAGLGGIMAI